MSGFSLGHLAILVLVLAILGPRRIPALLRGFGQAVKNFRDGRAGVQNAEFRRLDRQPDAEPLEPRT